MKLLFKFIFLLTISFQCSAQNIAITRDTITYETIIQPYVTSWENECISQLTTQEILTISDVILLSYQVIEASVKMSQARLVIQAELFNISTLSINDTFDARIHAQNNDLTKIKHAITEIEEAQEKIKSSCDTLKQFGPSLINMNPSTIQLFISNLKDVILHWAKTQQNVIANFEQMKQEFILTPCLFANINTIFETIVSADQIEHSQLLHGANSLTCMYKKIENMLADLTMIRTESIANFNILLTLFFKDHYQVLYNYLQNNHEKDFYVLATQDHTLPHPEQIFILE